MKKEVVHVPTRKIAEEVLRVAKENGLYEFTTSLDEMIRDSGFLLDISFESKTYCELSEYQKNHCKIITAQEFLNRYKSKDLIKGEWKTQDELTLELSKLKMENESLKQQLKAIEDQPKVGDVCLFWDSNHKTFAYGKLLDIKQGVTRPYVSIDKFVYSHCIKATDENIKEKIKELQDGE